MSDLTMKSVIDNGINDVARSKFEYLHYIDIYFIVPMGPIIKEAQ